MTELFNRAIRLCLIGIAAVIAASSGVVAVSPAPAYAKSIRQERYVDRIGDVVVSEVSLLDPLPAKFAAHPAACDTIRYLRFRQWGGPSGPGTADAVLSWMPGVYGNASSLQTLAVDTLDHLRAAKVGAEIWVISRRNSCVEDRSGAQEAVSHRNGQIAIDYYFGNGRVDGHTLARPTQNDLAWQSDYGLSQVMSDWHFVNAHELPDPAIRRKKLLIGGHSLGGLLASSYARWQFPDGPGFKQVAGDTAFDTLVTGDPGHRWLDAVPGFRDLVRILGEVTYPVALAILKSGLVPVTGGELLPTGPLGTMLADAGKAIDLTKISQILAEGFTLGNVAAIAARFNPNRESTLPKSLPNNITMNLFTSMLFTQNPFQAPGALIQTATGATLPSLVAGVDFRRWRLTNAAMFGSVFSTRSQPTFTSAHIGNFNTLTMPKYFIIPPQIRAIPFIGDLASGFGSLGPAVLPANPTGRLNGWNPNTSDTKVDFADAARDLGAGRLDATIKYESLRMIYETWLVLGGPQAPFPDLIRADTVKKIPHLAINGRIGIGANELGLDDPDHVIQLQESSHLDVVQSRRRGSVNTGQLVANFVRQNARK